MEDDLKYINEDLESAYEAAQYLRKIENRNRMLVKWTKLGKITVKKRVK